MNFVTWFSNWSSFGVTAAVLWFSFDQGIFAGAAGPGAFLVSSGVYLGGGTLILGAMTGDNQRKGTGIIVIVMCSLMSAGASISFIFPVVAVIAGGLAGFLASLSAPFLGEKMSSQDWRVLLVIIVAVLVISYIPSAWPVFLLIMGAIFIIPNISHRP